jgi:hypothetical protein
VDSKPLFPIEPLVAVDDRSLYYRDEDKAPMFYAESWALAHFMVHGPGMDRGRKLDQFFARLQQGSEQKEPCDRTSGLSRRWTKLFSST